MGLTGIPLAEAMTWVGTTRQHVDHLLEQESGPNKRAGLLQPQPTWPCSSTTLA